VNLRPDQAGGVWLRGLLALLVLAAAVAAWWWYAPDGIPSVMREQVVIPLTDLVAAKPDVLYKWKDAKGQWNVTDQPPVGRPYEAIRVNPNTNVLPAGEAPELD
jgi:hypothetical protein